MYNVNETDVIIIQISFVSYTALAYTMAIAGIEFYELEEQTNRIQNLPDLVFCSFRK